jgi:hypothetical protein
MLLAALLHLLLLPHPWLVYVLHGASEGAALLLIPDRCLLICVRCLRMASSLKAGTLLLG